jgi:serine/threonine protein kinase/Tfp pilus assembly protein PilF
MGVVYKAEDTRLKRLVALKFLPMDLTRDDEAKERFIHEAQAAAALDHPNICDIHEIGETEDGQLFIVMAYYDGETLKQRIAKGEERREKGEERAAPIAPRSSPFVMAGGLSVDSVIDIAIQISQGLAKAHEHGITHRDIKPANIMITKDGVVKILDFGLAKLAGQTRITKSGTTLGTVAYMSPEQARGEEVDHRTDIWSLGVVLYEMLTGQLPFKGEYEAAMMYSIVNEAPEPAANLRSDAPVELEKIINTCLEKEPSKRCQLVQELLVDLDQLKKKREAGIPSGKIARLAAMSRRFRALVAPAILLVVALLIGAGYFFFARMQPSEQPAEGTISKSEIKKSIAILYFKNNTGEVNLDHWRSALSDLMIADLSQSKYIKVLSEDRLFKILSQLNQLEAKSYSADVLQQVAARGRVEHLLIGNYAKAGENFRINIMLQKAGTGELIGSESVEGKGEASMFDMVDELTRRIKANFKLSAEEIADDIDENVGKITTSSPEAFKYYSEGRKYINKGDDRQSIQLMQKAVAIDPEFAMAYRSLSASYANLAYGSESGESLQKAFELSNRVSERERYLIEGHFHGVREPNKAMTAFNKLLQLYPDDETGNLQLGWMYVLSEDWDKAIQQFDVNVRNKSEAYQSYVMQAYSYMANGAYQKAGEILEFYRRNVADTPVIHFFLAGNFLCQGKYDLALAEVDKSLSQASTLFHPLYLKGDIYHCQGDLIKAEIEYQRLLAREEAGAHGYGICRLATLCLLNGKFEKAISQHKRGSNLHLAYMYLKSGNPVQAFAVCDKAWESAVKSKDLFEQIGILHFKGVIDLEMGQLDRAQNAADTLKPMIERSLYAKRIRYYHHLMGMIELKRGDFSQAIENFQSALTLLPAARRAIQIHARFAGRRDSSGGEQ